MTKATCAGAATATTDVLRTPYSVLGTRYESRATTDVPGTWYSVLRPALYSQGPIDPSLPGFGPCSRDLHRSHAAGRTGLQVPVASRCVAVLGTRYRVRLWWLCSCTLYLVPGTWYLVPGTEYRVRLYWLRSRASYQVAGTEYVSCGLDRSLQPTSRYHASSSWPRRSITPAAGARKTPNGTSGISSRVELPSASSVCPVERRRRAKAIG
jgi:hypothetical protein